MLVHKNTILSVNYFNYFEQKKDIILKLYKNTILIKFFYKGEKRNIIFWKIFFLTFLARSIC